MKFNQLLSTAKVKKEYLIITLPIPFVLNFLYNYIQNDFSVPHLKLTNILYAFFAFCFLCSIGQLISHSLGLNSISFSIVIYLISFFAIDYTYLIFQYDETSFSLMFYVTNILWLLLLSRFFKKKYLIYCFNILFTFIILKVLNSTIGEKLFTPIETRGDVEYFWFPMTKILYDNNLEYALINNIVPGYGLMINHVHAVLFKLTISDPTFEFVSAVPNIFLFVSILFILETRFSYLIKTVCSIMLLTIVVNSYWLSYLLINSLMGEGVISLFFPIIIYNLLKHKISKYSYIDILVFIIIGFFYLSKPFASFIFLLIIVIFSYRHKNMRLLILGFLGFLINYLIYKFVITNSYSNNYFNKTELMDFDILNFRNIIDIFLNLIQLDRVMSLFLFILLTLIFINYLFKNYIDDSIYIFFIIFINILLVALLYVSFWQDRELESAYRYIFSIFNMYILGLGFELKKLNS
jgi:hypothetical protein